MRLAIRCRPRYLCLLPSAFDPAQRVVASSPSFHNIPGADFPDQNSAISLAAVAASAAAAVIPTAIPQQASKRAVQEIVQALWVAGEEAVRGSGASRAQRARGERREEGEGRREERAAGLASARNALGADAACRRGRYG